MIVRPVHLRRIFVFVAALAAVAVLPPAGAQTPSPSAARGLIWEVARGDRIGWLVGSLHVLTAEHYPLPDAIEQAFGRADTLVGEVDPAQLESPQVMAAIMVRGFYTGGDTLEASLPPQTWGLVRDRAERAGLPLDTLRRMRPWLAGVTLAGLELQRAGFDPAFGIDSYFHRKATEEQKSFRALESAEQQVDYLASFPPPVQEQLLRSSLEDAERQMREVQSLVAAWRTGDATALARLLLDAFEESPEVYQSLLVERNRRWMPALESCLQERACFIVVGAGHTVGEDGLVSMLQARGYRVEQR